MKIHHYPSQAEVLHDTVLTIGSFDGVHLGHSEILRKMVRAAQNNALQTCLLTFHPHPREVIKKNSAIELITSEEEKITLLQEAGLDHLVIVHFDLEFANQSAEEYVEKFLVKNFQPKIIIIGHDHRFGKNQSGDVALLKTLGKKWGFEVIETQAQEVGGTIISSTKIRKALQQGDVKTANALLGHSFQLKGKVIHGQKIGRDLGFPTANLELLDSKKILPKLGIYAVKVKIDHHVHKGMLYIGYRPSIANAQSLNIEVNIFNFEASIYDKTIVLIFVDYLRADRHFVSLDDLKTQLQLDKEAAEHILSN